MGAGGEFFALSDDQLQRLLSGELAHGGFLQPGGAEQPREAFTQAAQVWYELSQVLQAEAACGAQQSDRIPDLVGYSSAQQVQATAAKLARRATCRKISRSSRLGRLFTIRAPRIDDSPDYLRLASL